jgi:hypothetical protein
LKEMDMNMTHLGFYHLVALSVLIPALGLADQHGPPPPPKEAFEACAGAKQGDACTVRFGDHEIAGRCDAPPGGGLACRPDGAPSPPPKEALDACAGAKEGDACTVDFGGRKVSGTCALSPEGLACRPERPPPESRERNRVQ